jgi:hypothetical protein
MVMSTMVLCSLLFALDDSPLCHRQQGSFVPSKNVLALPHALLSIVTTTTSGVMAIQIDNHPTNQYGTIANILDQGMSGCAQV